MKLSEAILQGKEFELNGEDCVYDPESNRILNPRCSISFEEVDELDKVIKDALYLAYKQGFEKAKLQAFKAIKEIACF